MKENKLYMKWWFWVIIGLMFFWVIVGIIAIIPDLETEDELIECREALVEWVEWFDEYEELMEEYCELDPTNPLC